jgi:hypothetical protein
MPEIPGGNASRCPHCGTMSINTDDPIAHWALMDGVPAWIRLSTEQHARAKGACLMFDAFYCTACNKPTVVAHKGTFDGWDDERLQALSGGWDEPLGVIWPRHDYYRPLHPEVPVPIAQEYQQACQVLEISPNAAVVLVRRALQLLFRLESGTEESHPLWRDKQLFLESRALSPRVERALSILTDIGAVGAHPGIEGYTLLNIEKDEAKHALEVLREILEQIYPPLKPEGDDPLEALEQTHQRKHRPPRRRG